MRIRLDAKLRTKDGHDAGHVKHAIWDPSSNAVRSFVVSTGGLLGHDVLVSREVLESARMGGEEIVVDLTKDELGRLDRYEEKGYAAPPIGWTGPAMYDFPASVYLLPIEPVNEPAPTRPERPTIRTGMPVRDTDRRSIGTVKEIRIDDMTGELRSIVVEETALGRGGTTELPADHIDVGVDEVQVIAGPTREERRT